MTLNGISTSYESINSLQSRLLAEASYRVADQHVSPNRSTDRFRFRQQFDMRVDLQKRPPGQYLREIEEQSRSSEGDGANFMEGPP
jgi:hypothetical protein